MLTIATDLDRTLFPNGKQEYDGSMPLFKQILQEKELQLIFVTGRNLNQIQEGIQKHDPPMPSYAIAEVGTKIYACEGENFTEEKGYVDFIKENTRGWDVKAFEAALKAISELRLQEDFNQNEFKLSYYIDQPEKSKTVVENSTQIIQKTCPDSSITYSVDETKGLGLMDILPTRANKMEGIEYLRRKLGIEKDSIIYCGDSGNDITPLTFGYKAILVRNAIDEVRREVQSIAADKGISNQIYLAQGAQKLNGNYVSGIIEGLKHFGVID